MPYQNLVFFNKEGDYLNFKYNNQLERFEGDILFHSNSTDTFKTYGLYYLENVQSKDFESQGRLKTRRYQLFNEYGFHFYKGGTTKNVEKIEPSNNDPNFYSKWIYGNNFESLFPIGTIFKFNQNYLEFDNPNIVYSVVQTKKNAILFISNQDNKSFENDWLTIFSNKNSYSNITITSLNILGVYDYIDEDYISTLSIWNERDFFRRIYKNRHLNIVNSNSNNGILSVKNENLIDQRHFEYEVNSNSLINNYPLIGEIILKTDLPRIYEGSINLLNKKIYVSNYPEILKPNTIFKIIGNAPISNLNLTVDNIPIWEGINSNRIFNIEDQVIYNNKIYQCLIAYTHDFSDNVISFETPENSSKWGEPTHIKIKENYTNQSLFGDLYLITNKFNFQTDWNTSKEVTISNFVEKYKDTFKSFNIDLFIDNNKIKADLIYASDYLTINFYSNNGLISNKIYKTERIVEVNESLENELNYNKSEIYEYNIVFEQLNSFGIKIKINGQLYEEETTLIYQGLEINQEKTIDATLKKWLTRNYIPLYILGINAELKYTGTSPSIYVNSIYLKTDYPNVPINLNEINLGISGSYHIEHSVVTFNNIGPYFNINILDRDYITDVIYLPNTNLVDIELTLQKWVEDWSNSLFIRGIKVYNIYNKLYFNVDINNINLKYNIITNNLDFPGLNNLSIEEKIFGNFGVLIASNEILLEEPEILLNSNTEQSSFIDEGFSEGMIVDINNTYRTLVNTEFNILYLENNTINLSYEGPFWDISTEGDDDDNVKICDGSPFNVIAFNIGFQQDLCVGDVNNTSGPFSEIMFGNKEFKIYYGSNQNILNTYNYNTIINYEYQNLNDVLFLPLNGLIYILGKDIYILKSDTNELEKVITVNLVNPKKIVFNNTNNKLYLLSSNRLCIVNPLDNNLIAIIPLNSIAKDIEINKETGDVYVSFENNKVEIWSNSNYNIVSTEVINIGSVTEIGTLIYNQSKKSVVLWSNLGILNISKNRIVDEIFEIENSSNFLFYNTFNDSVFIHHNNFVSLLKNNNLENLYPSNDIPTLTINPLNNTIITLSDGIFRVINEDLEYSSYNTDLNGKLTVNPYDGDVYITNSNQINVINPNNGLILNSFDKNGIKTIYNPLRKSIFGISDFNIFEIKVNLNNKILLSTSVNNINDPSNSYGTLDPSYQPRPSIWLNTREFLQKPKENYPNDPRVKYVWKWEINENNPFFLYDFSTDQLPKGLSYSYTGEAPLKNPVLLTEPNKDLDKITLSSYQQTIFKEVVKELDYIDNIQNNNIVEPLQLFIGYKSVDEGANINVLKLIKREEIFLDFNSDINNYITIEETIINNTRKCIIYLNENSDLFFTEKGLKSDQLIAIYLKDNTNSLNQYTSDNNASVFKIEQVFTKSILLNFLNETDFVINESTKVNDYPNTNNITYLKFSIKVLDKEIGRFTVYGETEDEDERYKIELGNLGKLISPEQIFIFKEYDILEGGIDWNFLNKKRKEMLMMKHLIYPYIGAYKSIINAINYFGYNDLQLNEYYRNINIQSENFEKLFKVEIPDIFDNSVEGWEESDFIKNTYPNENYEETNLFNLTYFITDKEGNHILTYTLDEVIIKLQGLKYWLKSNIIPLTHKILDITGQFYIPHSNTIIHKLHDIQIFNIKEEMSPISCKLTEAYLMPINSGSAVYNCVLEFFSIIPNIGSENIEKPKPFNGSNLINPDYYDIKIKTYQTYKEWNPLFVYKKGDRVNYLNRIFESVIVNNRVNNPYKYSTSKKWNLVDTYTISEVVEYNRDYYVYKGLNPDSNLTPNKDSQNWLIITEWKELDYEPVQTIHEYRKGDNLLPFNFTIDSNIDPLITIEVTSDNGYGEIYSDRKNYEIISIKEILTIVAIDQLPKITSELKIKDDPNIIDIPTIDIEPEVEARYPHVLRYGENCDEACQ